MKEDSRVYDYVERETKEKIERFEARFTFGLEVNLIKAQIFEGRPEENEQNRFLPKIAQPGTKAPLNNDSVSYSQRSFGRPDGSKDIDANPNSRSIDKEKSIEKIARSIIHQPQSRKLALFAVFN